MAAPDCWVRPEGIDSRRQTTADPLRGIASTRRADVRVVALDELGQCSVAGGGWLISQLQAGACPRRGLRRRSLRLRFCSANRDAVVSNGADVALADREREETFTTRDAAPQPAIAVVTALDARRTSAFGGSDTVDRESR